MTSPLPRLTRPRRDGWTPAVQRRFLDALAVSGSPVRAAAAAGRSMQSAYKLRARPEAAAFRDGWAAALTSCMLQVREQALERAFHGHVEPIIKRGRKVGERQIFNNGMLLALMRLYDAPAYHADRTRAAADAAAAVPLTPDQLLAQFAAGLAQLAHKDFAQVDENATYFCCSGSSSIRLRRTRTSLNYRAARHPRLRGGDEVGCGGKTSGTR